jgi:hypothetical protein
MLQKQILHRRRRRRSSASASDDWQVVVVRGSATSATSMEDIFSVVDRDCAEASRVVFAHLLCAVNVRRMAENTDRALVFNNGEKKPVVWPSRRYNAATGPDLSFHHARLRFMFPIRQSSHPLPDWKGCYSKTVHVNLRRIPGSSQ